MRHVILVYGVLCYAVFFMTFLYAIGFLGNVVAPKSIDSGPESPLGVALAINLVLLGVFGLQHSIMARPAFKRWWKNLVPIPAERSTYVLLSSLALILLYWQWRPLTGVVWQVDSPAGRGILWGLFAFGWLTVLVTTFLINHFDLFGLRQVWFHWREQDYHHVTFKAPGPYRYVRHPLYVGWFFAFWSIPDMTLGHLLFALGTSAYILVAIHLEERDLETFLGEPYARYRRTVPMLIPFLRRSNTHDAATRET